MVIVPRKSSAGDRGHRIVTARSMSRLYFAGKRLDSISGALNNQISRSGISSKKNKCCTTSQKSCAHMVLTLISVGSVSHASLRPFFAAWTEIAKIRLQKQGGKASVEDFLHILICIPAKRFVSKKRQLHLVSPGSRYCRSGSSYGWVQAGPTVIRR